MGHATPSPILSTKLHKPVVKEHYVLRRALLESLENDRSKPLTLVVAPTGYGKSITISEWLDFASAKRCWVSVDEDLNDFRTFLSYFAGAIRGAIPRALRGLGELLEAPSLPPEKVIANTLINDLEGIKDDVIAVLDDYHHISSQHVHNLVNYILKDPPRGFHLVVISRRDPPLNLGSLRSFGLVNEIRMSDLSFRPNEVATLARNLVGTTLNDDAVALLLERTEGWVVGVRLALLALSKTEDIEAILEELKGDRHEFYQYLMDEVLDGQPKEKRLVLLLASLSERFNYELLQAVLAEDRDSVDGTAMSVAKDSFDDLVKSLLFIIPLDMSQHWFRYHHLFRSFLLGHLEKQFTKEQIAEYHKKASAYFEHHGLYDEAIGHALRANDIARVIRTIERTRDALMDAEQFDQVWKWLNMLPAGIVDEHPQLLLARALLHDSIPDYEHMQEDVARADQLLHNRVEFASRPDNVWGEYHAIRSCLSFITGDTSTAERESDDALRHLLPSQSYSRFFASAYRSFALHMTGRSETAEAFLTATLETIPTSATYSRIRFLTLKSMLYAFRGELSDLRRSSLRVQSLSLRSKLWNAFALSEYFLGAISYQRNELAEAVRQVDAVVTRPYASRAAYVLNCLFLKAFSLQAMNDEEALGQCLRQIAAYADVFEQEQIRGLVNAFRVELALREDDLSGALALHDAADYDVYPPFFSFYFPQLSPIRLLMQTGDSTKIREAESRLADLIQFGRSTFRQNLLGQALPLHALLLFKKGEEKKSFAALQEVLTMSEAEGFFRNFLDLGEPMEGVLKKFPDHGPVNKYRVRLLEAFKKERIIQKGEHPGPLDGPPGLSAALLSRGEKELLKYLSEGYRNKEIAAFLHLSPESIKKKLSSIYSKLRVSNRAAAVAKTAELGLLQ